MNLIRFKNVAVFTAFLALGSLLYAQAPANDAFAAAEVLATATPKSGTVANATSETNEPPTHLQNTANATTGAATARSVWYSWTPTTSGMAYFELNSAVTGTAAGAVMQGAAYSGSAINALTRIASAYAPAGAAGPPVTDGAKGYSNYFPVMAGTTYFLQVTGNTATAGGNFVLAAYVLPQGGTVVLPFGSNWDYLHPTAAGENPTTHSSWATTWQVVGDQTDYGVAPAVSKFTLAAPAPLGWGGLDRGPGQRTNIGASSSVATGNTANNAAWFRTSFTLATATSNLWAEILADDGAWIFINGQPIAPVNIRAKVTVSGTTYSFTDGYSLPSAHLTTACMANNATDTEQQTKMVFLGALAAGTHTIAVSVHQNNVTSSDLGFDLQLIDRTPRKLTDGEVKIGFEAVPYTAAGNGAGITAQQFAPKPTQPDAAWKVLAPALRGTTALNAPFVLNNATTGTQGKALRLNAGEAAPFTTEPIDVTGLTTFVASVRILATDTSTGFEPDDTLRVYLETSPDGIAWTDPGNLNIQPTIADDAILTAFPTWTVVSLPVTGNTANYVRLVVTGGVDSGNESIYLDDFQVSLCRVAPTVTNVTLLTGNDDDPLNDQVSFNLVVDGTNTTGPGWVTVGFGAGNEVSSPGFGAANMQTIVRPAVNSSGVRTNVTFFVEDAGNPACRSAVTVVVPPCAIAVPSIVSVTRQPGSSATDPDDDTLTVTLNTPLSTGGVTYQFRSNDTNNTLYGAGAYGSNVTVANIPIYTTVGTTKTFTATLRLQDVADPTCRRAVTLNGFIPVAMGTSAFGSPVLYGTPSMTTGSHWRQMTANVANSNFTFDATSLQFSPAAAPAAGTMEIETPAVTITGQTGVKVTAKLRAFENSAASGFETTDTFKIEVITAVGAAETTHNLIDGLAADRNNNDLLNGNTAANAAAYDADKTLDEFNQDQANEAGNSSGTFDFSFNVPDGTDTVKVRLTGNNNSASEYFFVQGLHIGSGPVDSDSDGLADDWETLHFGNLAQGASDDPDGDGQTNASEQLAGTLPNDGTSVLSITSFSIGSSIGSTTSLTFNSAPGKIYRAQWSQNLTDWTDIGANTDSGGATTTISGLPVPPSTEEKWFYRVRIVP